MINVVPEQQLLDNTPIATVMGKHWLEMPQDLYIPPDALEVFLEAFEGPLDFLLYLIKKQNLDILDIPIAKITAQYLEYIAMMEGLRFELAAEYLVMAASLAEIKSRMLLPRPETAEEDVEDPRAELVRRLQEYERYKKAAENLDALPRMERDMAKAWVQLPEMTQEKPLPTVHLNELLQAFQEVLQRATLTQRHLVQLEPLSVRERMGLVLEALSGDNLVPFHALFNVAEGRAGVVVSFLAILELLRNSAIEIVQSEPLSPIYLRAATAALSE